MEDSKIVNLNGEKFDVEEEEDEDLSPKAILRSAEDINWDFVMVIGTDNRGQINVVGHPDTAAECNLLIDRVKLKLLELLDL